MAGAAFTDTGFGAGADGTGSAGLITVGLAFGELCVTFGVAPAATATFSFLTGFFTSLAGYLYAFSACFSTHGSLSYDSLSLNDKEKRIKNIVSKIHN